MKMLIFAAILLITVPVFGQSISMDGKRFDVSVEIAGNDFVQLGVAGGNNKVIHGGLALTFTPFEFMHVRIVDGFRFTDGFAYEDRGFRFDVGFRYRSAFIERSHQINTMNGNQQYIHIGVRLGLIPMFR